MRTSNPALNDKIFGREQEYVESSSAMSVEGTVYKTAILLGLAMLTACFTWRLFYNAGAGAASAEAAMAAAQQAVLPWLIGGAIGGLVLALITIFVQKASPITAPLYALAEGLFLGGISAMFEARYGGIVMPAIGLTFGVLATMLVLYTTGLVQATQKFRTGVMAATGAIFFVYIGTMLLGFFGINVPYIHEGGMIGIGFSLFVVVIAALNLVLDFDFIEKGATHGLPRYMEWFGAFGLMVTLIWLYLEILRLLAKMRD